ncbi:MAG: SMC-Scp complex subunit ScpB, partial [Candidatus Micrarchaeota archaeon]|nr:SMC-Scp complex subunit ScpB [Candidatus Micrarchaeota archaeon]
PSDEPQKTDGQDAASLEGLVDMGRFEAMTPPEGFDAGAVQVQKEPQKRDDDAGMAEVRETGDEESNPDAYHDDGQSEDNRDPNDPEAQSAEQHEQLQVIQNQPDLAPLRVLEAALFLANKPLSYKQMQDILQTPRERINVLLLELAEWLPKDSAVQLMVNEHGAAFQLKPQYVERVAKLSKEVELSRKAMKILALVAKKKQFLQSELKHYFRGEIYAYVTELKQSGYVESKKSGNTRLLKPTTKFYESFQLKE